MMANAVNDGPLHCKFRHEAQLLENSDSQKYQQPAQIPNAGISAVGWRQVSRFSSQWTEKCEAVQVFWVMENTQKAY